MRIMDAFGRVLEGSALELAQFANAEIRGEHAIADERLSAAEHRLAPAVEAGSASSQLLELSVLVKSLVAEVADLKARALRAETSASTPPPAEAETTVVPLAARKAYARKPKAEEPAAEQPAPIEEPTREPEPAPAAIEPAETPQAAPSEEDLRQAVNVAISDAQKRGLTTPAIKEALAPIFGCEPKDVPNRAKMPADKLEAVVAALGAL